MKRISQSWLIIIFIISIITLSIAFIAEYFFNLIPCDMCLKQRYPYYLIGILATINLFINSNDLIKTLIIKLSIISTAFFGVIYSIYHVGIERKFWVGASECSSQNTALDIETLSAQIMNMPIIRCDEPTLLFNLISIAELNVLAMTLLLIFNIIVLYKSS